MNLILALLLMATDAAPLAGTLCFDGARECVATSGTRIDVAKHDAQRAYTWASEDGRTVVVGELQPDVERIDLALPSSPGETDPRRQAVTLSVRGDAGRGWPADVGFTLKQSKEKSWTWTLPAGSTKGEMTIHLPAGEYRLWAEAKRHRSASRQIRANENLDLGQVTLDPLPSISGRITRLDGERIVSVAGARIALSDGRIATTANEQGAFRVELPEPIPEEIKVTSPGLGVRIVPLERLGSENDLGEIRLEAGVRLRLELDRTGEARDQTIRVRLQKRGTRYEHSPVTSRKMRPEQESIELADLSAGDYLVLLEGDHELERLVLPVEIGAANVTKRVEIHPWVLEGTVAIGEEPLREGTVRLTPYNLGPTWEATVPTDRDGRFRGTFWQTGRLNALVKVSDALGGLMYTESPELGSDPSRWDIRFRKRTIHGRVLDAETGGGVGAVKLKLQTETAGGSRGYSSVQVAENGAYEIAAWQDAVYDLTVASEEYLSKTTSVALTDSDGSRKVDIALERGTRVTLAVVWTSGQPVAEAQILEGVARDGHNAELFHKTDAAGRLPLRVASGQTRVLYVLPREGSLAVARVGAAGAGDKPVRVEVLPPTGTLQLELQNADGKGADGFVMLRYNGEWIPYPVSGRMRGARIAEGKREFYGLPAGAWEIWALAPTNVPRSIPNRVPTHAPVRVGVASGVTKAEVTVVAIPFD
ncbi:MAG: carboxypeptidase-like regulatory domain-containing protein [Thermoanaerobaculia bacterium]|nr:carboxypeptidase-like regulatory domain-containing protein [Thermoanaerobaculia bacterium]